MGKFKLLFIIPKRNYLSGDVPLGICSLSSYLKSKIKDLTVETYDCNVRGNNLEIFKSFIDQNCFDLIGFYVDSLSFTQIKSLSKIARKFTKCLVAGGPEVTANIDNLLNLTHFDFLVKGEGEKKLESIIKRENISKIPDIYYLENGKFLYTSQPKESEFIDLSELPFPDRSIINMDFYKNRFLYFDILGPKVQGTTIIASRGCPFKCSFCYPFLYNHFGKKIRYRPVKSIIEEIKFLHDKYNISSFFFHDDTMTLNKRWLFLLCDEIIKLPFKILWGLNSRVDTFDEEIAQKLKQSNLKKIHFGIESGSERILNGILKKNITKKQIRNTLYLTKKYEIKTLGFFILGSPGEKKLDIFKTLLLSKTLPLNEASFSIFSPFKGSELGNKVNSNFNNYEFNYYSKSVTGNNYLSAKEIRFYQVLAFINFYFSFKKIIFLLKHLFSFKGFERLIIKLNRVFGETN